jgi:hypothetical protein
VVRIIPFCGAAGEEELWHLLGIHVSLHCRIGGGARRLEDKQDLVAFNELARLLDRLGRAVGVVVADEIDLTAVDTALSVDLLKICGFSFPISP